MVGETTEKKLQDYRALYWDTKDWLNYYTAENTRLWAVIQGLRCDLLHTRFDGKLCYGRRVDITGKNVLGREGLEATGVSYEEN